MLSLITWHLRKARGVFLRKRASGISCLSNIIKLMYCSILCHNPTLFEYQGLQDSSINTHDNMHTGGQCDHSIQYRRLMRTTPVECSADWPIVHCMSLVA